MVCEAAASRRGANYEMDYSIMMGMIISLLSGAAGGNVAGALMKKFSLGTIGNSVAGIAGGGLGGGILSMLGAGGAAASGGDAGGIGSLVGSVASGGVGGGALMAIIGMVRSAMGR